MTEYDGFALFYDLYYAQTTDDIEMYREIARSLPRTARVLELACGTGRLLMPLLKDGLDVTGLDLSPEMLELARKKLAAEKDEVRARARVLEGDMRSPGPVLNGETFDLVILGFNSFQHLLNETDQSDCLEAVSNLLKPKGRFVLSVIRPEVDEKAPARNRTEFWGSFSNPNRNSQVKLLAGISEYPEVKQRVVRYNFYESLPDGTTQLMSAPLTLRYFSREELEGLFQRAGFKVEALYGSYKFEKFNGESTKMVFICTKKG